MSSITHVFIAQLEGKPTKQRYHAATIFLDQYSDINYVHLKRGFSSDKTIQLKKSFEAYACMYRVKKSTNIRTMEYLQTSPSYRQPYKKTRRLAIVEWILTSVMAKLKAHQGSSIADEKITPLRQGKVAKLCRTGSIVLRSHKINLPCKLLTWQGRRLLTIGKVLQCPRWTKTQRKTLFWVPSFRFP